MKGNKQGRPFAYEAKKNWIQVRIGSKEQEMLDFIISKTGETKSDVIRRGLLNCYNIAKYSDEV